MVASQSEIAKALQSLSPGFAFAGVFSGVINLLYLASPLYLMQIYNRVLVSENVATLLLLTLILFVALLTMGVLDAVRAQVLIRSGVKLDTLLSKRVFGALIIQSASQGYSKGGSRLRQLDQFRTFITGPGVHFAFDVPWIPIYLILLFFIHPVLGAVATVGAALLGLLALLNERLTRPSLQLSEVAGSKAFSFSENLLRHSDVVVAMGMQPDIEKRWQHDRDGMLTTQAYASDRNAVVSATIRFARLLLQGLMLGTGAWLAIDGVIQPATIFASSIILGRALVPVEQGVAAWRQFGEAREAYRQVGGLLAEVPARAERTSVPNTDNSIETHKVGFALAGRPQSVLADVSFRIEPGQAVGIVGPSGSGKSTLARLLIGAIAPTAGELHYGGVELGKWNRDEFGRQVGYLPQDVGLFAGTVRENIARFADVAIEDVIAAAGKAGIHEMIMELPRHYDTVLGPDGVGLSGGQRQRLGLARALLGNPALLVLDEPNANLDVAGEEGLRHALERLKEAGTTIVVVTHRTTVLQAVDRLMFLRDGRLEAFGPPEQVFDYIKTKVVPQARKAA